jgi:acyl-[acyl-carrier-protein]-phospholipid O-acyltransferase/long-chain-fatty-acid--[acyl-carrier-protein] ligase
VVGAASSVVEGGRDVALAGALFGAPFLLFSAYAGALADRISKRTLALACKVAEILVMAFGTAALAMGYKPALFALLFLMGLHSAFFAPAKYGILPEILEEKTLSWGNGLLQLFTFLAIIVGTVLGGLLLDFTRPHLALAGAIFLAIAGLGLGSSFFIPHVPPSGSKVPWPTDPVTALWRDLRDASRDRPLFLSLLGVGLFWVVGTLLYSDLMLYGKKLMGLSNTAASLLLVFLAGGIGLGSAAAGKLSGDRVELGLIPLGALGMGALSFALGFTHRSYALTGVTLAGLGAAGGFFIVPLNAIIQERAPADQRGRFTAFANVMSFLGILSSSAVFWFMTSVLQWGPGRAAAATGAMTFVAALGVLGFLPQGFVRLVLFFVARTVYRVEGRGLEHFPSKGPALLVCDHASLADPLLLSAAVDRPIRFLMWRGYFELPGFRWLLRAMKGIPMSPVDGADALAAAFEEGRAALRRGEVVCLFSEGDISILARKLGRDLNVGTLLQDSDAPVVPTHLDRVWGGVSSFRIGRHFFQVPRRWPYPVTVSFGPPLRNPTDVGAVRKAVRDLGSEAFRLRIEGMLPLHRDFLRQARRQWTREAVSDSTGARLSYGKFVVASAFLSRKIREVCPEESPLAVLLPPCVPAALVNVAVALAGRTCINLNYTLSKDLIDYILIRSGTGRILTSRRMIQALRWDPDPRMAFIEDFGFPPKLQGGAQYVLFRLLPAALWEKLFPGGRTRIGGLASLVFTSGSTGVPKGVMLTHANIQANLQSCLEVLQLERRDKLLGVLPFFHSFGYLATLWYPLLSGVRVTYHRSPLEAEAVEQALRREKATVVLTTPTILGMWAKKWSRESARSLRFIVTGAEKLRETTSEEAESLFGVPVLEGYGCTELSPVACLSGRNVEDDGEFREGSRHGKVGRPLPGVSLRVVDPTDRRSLPEGSAGLLLVKGPNVMKGYWGMPEATAEVVRDGWYETGDIAAVDEDGFVEIIDRISRFSKIGGEMAPHVLIEERIKALSGEPDARFFVTSVPDSRKGESLVVLHNNFPGDADALLARLAASGLPPLWVPDRRNVFAVDEWPLLGIGKVDMGKARRIALELMKR